MGTYASKRVEIQVLVSLKYFYYAWPAPVVLPRAACFVDLCLMKVTTHRADSAISSARACNHYKLFPFFLTVHYWTNILWGEKHVFLPLPSPSFYSLCSVALSKLSIWWLENNKRQLCEWDNKQPQKIQYKRHPWSMCLEVIISYCICLNLISQRWLLLLLCAALSLLWGRKSTWIWQCPRLCHRVPHMWFCSRVEKTFKLSGVNVTHLKTLPNSVLTWRQRVLHTLTWKKAQYILYVHTLLIQINKCTFMVWSSLVAPS